MVDQPNVGSAPAGNPQAGAAGGSGDSSVVSGGSWITGLQDAGNRDLAAKKGWDKASSPDVVVASYRELEGRLGKSIVIPDANAPKEDYEKLYTALGKPKTPGDYTLKLPQGVQENFPYDDAFATEYKTWSHEAGLSPHQAQSLHDKFVLRTQKQMNDAWTDQQRKIGSAHQEIVAKWGPVEGTGYTEGVSHAAAALNGLGLRDTFKGAGLLTQDGKITDAKLAFALATVGAGLFREDASRGAPGHLTANNPWKDGQENLTEQGRILKQNPDLAKSLILAAGKDPNKVLYKGR